MPKHPGTRVTATALVRAGVLDTIRTLSQDHREDWYINLHTVSDVMVVAAMDEGNDLAGGQIIITYRDSQGTPALEAFDVGLGVDGAALRITAPTTEQDQAGDPPSAGLPVPVARGLNHLLSTSVNLAKGGVTQAGHWRRSGTDPQKRSQRPPQ